MRAQDAFDENAPLPDATLETLAWLDAKDAVLDERTEALRELLAVLDERYPKGQGQRLPGVTLFAAMEKAREALSTPSGA